MNLSKRRQRMALNDVGYIERVISLMLFLLMTRKRITSEIHSRRYRIVGRYRWVAAESRISTHGLLSVLSKHIEYVETHTSMCCTIQDLVHFKRKLSLRLFSLQTPVIGNDKDSNSCVQNHRHFSKLLGNNDIIIIPQSLCRSFK